MWLMCNLRWLFPELNIFKPFASLPPRSEFEIFAPWFVSIAESFISCLLHLVSTPPEAVGCPESTVVFCYFLIAKKSFYDWVSAYLSVNYTSVPRFADRALSRPSDISRLSLDILASPSEPMKEVYLVLGSFYESLWKILLGIVSSFGVVVVVLAAG